MSWAIRFGSRTISFFCDIPLLNSWNSFDFNYRKIHQLLENYLKSTFTTSLSKKNEIHSKRPHWNILKFNSSNMHPKQIFKVLRVILHFCFHKTQHLRLFQTAAKFSLSIFKRNFLLIWHWFRERSELLAKNEASCWFCISIKVSFCC